MNRVVWRNNLGYSLENRRVPESQLLGCADLRPAARRALNGVLFIYSCAFDLLCISEVCK